MITKDKDLHELNTFGIHASAREFASFSSIDELDNIISSNRQKPLFILGGGSNILLTKDVDALVLRNEIKGIEILKEDGNEVLIRSGAGEVWHEFVLTCLQLELGGLENLSLIPGSVGASPMQNIGAYGVEIKDVFEELEAYHIESGEVHTFNKEQCEFGYRESVFKLKLKGQYVITSVTFKLNREHKVNATYGAINEELKKMGVTTPCIHDISNAVIAIRSSKLPDPKQLGNAGSFFKNPVVDEEILEAIKVNFPEVPSYPAEPGKVKLAAGWLIEKAGWKGFTAKNCGVHKLQALVLVNYGGATGQEIFDLSTQILEDVKQKFGVQLEREVNIL
mgnify:FL=1